MLNPAEALGRLRIWREEARMHKREIRRHRSQLQVVMTTITEFEQELKNHGIQLEQGEGEYHGQNKSAP